MQHRQIRLWKTELSIAIRFNSLKFLFTILCLVNNTHNNNKITYTQVRHSEEVRVGHNLSYNHFEFNNAMCEHLTREPFLRDFSYQTGIVEICYIIVGSFWSLLFCNLLVGMTLVVVKNPT